MRYFVTFCWRPIVASVSRVRRSSEESRYKASYSMLVRRLLALARLISSKIISRGQDADSLSVMHEIVCASAIARA